MIRGTWLLVWLLLGCSEQAQEQDLVGSVTVDGPRDPSSVVLNEGPARVTVIVQDPAGAIVHRTAPQGWAAHFGINPPPDGMITIHVHDQLGEQAFTWTHVQPGDHLAFDAGPKLVVHRISFSVPEVAGASDYMFYAKCQNPSYGGHFGHITPSELIATATIIGTGTICLENDTKLAVIVVATTMTGISAAIAQDVPLVANGVTVATLGPYVSPVSAVTARLQNAAAFQGSTSSLATDIELASKDRLYYASAAGDLSTVGPVPSASGPGYVTLTLATSSALVPSRESWLRRLFSMIPNALEIDVQTELLPPVSASIDTNAVRPTIIWTAGAAVPEGATYAAVAASVGQLRWTVMVPPQAGAVKFPELPEDLRGNGSTLLFIELVEASDLNGYDDARNSGAFVFPPMNELRVSTADYQTPGGFRL